MSRLALAKYQALRRKGLLKGSIRSCMEKSSRREAARYGATDCARQNLIVIPFGARTAARFQVLASGIKSRVRRLGEVRPTARIFQKRMDFDVVSIGRYGNYPAYKYVPEIRSCGIVSPRRLLAFIGINRYSVGLPRGYRFGKDAHGLYIRKNSGKTEDHRYHFHTDDVVGGAAALIEALKQHLVELKVSRKVDKVVAKLKAGKPLDYSGVVVTYGDARRAGCCRAGILTFLTKLKESGSSGILAERLLEIGNRVTEYTRDRIRASAETAYLRSLRDDARGWCLLHEAGEPEGQD